MANPAEATTTAVACGDVLTTDTTLTADLTCPAGALTIGADDVDLDLNSHTITGSGTGNGLKATGRQGTTVRNGTITGFTYAIYIDYGGAVLTVSATDRGVFTRNVFDAFPMGGLHSSSMLKHRIVRRNVFNGNKTVGMFVENSYGSNRAGPDPVSDNVFVGNGHNPSGLVDRQGQVVQGGIHLASRLAVTPPVTLRNNVGTGNVGHLIWAPPGTVADGGGNQGPCGPSPNPDLTCW
ncbi:hypothetical protein [Nonomuraea sp. NPDC001023]|uniref:hypothetical protein n=1 Tax=unclassified Nonomuraea TaxID=2593643 RepID=UPI00331B711B